MAEFEVNESYGYAVSEDFQLEALEARVIIHFRPRVGWKGIGYGFDWMHIGDYPEIEPDPRYNHTASYEKIISKQYTSIENGIIQEVQRRTEKLRRNLTEEEIQSIMQNPRPHLIKDGIPYMLEGLSNSRAGIFFEDEVSYQTLEREYQYRLILAKPIEREGERGTDFERYYCSWLSLYPTKSAALSAIVEVLPGAPESYTIDFYNENENYTVNKLKQIDNLPVGRHVIKDAIEVVSNKEHTEDSTIVAGYCLEDQYLCREAGTIIAWANDTRKQKEAKIIMVKVTTKEDDKSLPQEIEEVQQKENILSEYQKEANEFLRQMFIDIASSISINIDVSDDRRFQHKGDYHSQKGILVNNRNIPTGEKVYRYLDKECEKEFKRKYPQSKNGYGKYLRIFFFDQLLYDYDRSTHTSKKAGHGSIEDTPYIIFSSNVAGGYELAHEIAHSFGLEHTFANKEFHPNSKFTYEGVYTDNIMDYTQLGYSKKPEQYKCFQFWHWQWEIANRRVR